MDLTATRFEVEDRIATVWLDRPHRANAWTGQMHAEYRWIMAELEQRDDVRAVVVTGTGDRFCVGGDCGCPDRTRRTWRIRHRLASGTRPTWRR